MHYKYVHAKQWDFVEECYLGRLGWIGVLCRFLLWQPTQCLWIATNLPLDMEPGSWWYQVRLLRFGTLSCWLGNFNPPKPKVNVFWESSELPFRSCCQNVAPAISWLLRYPLDIAEQQRCSAEQWWEFHKLWNFPGREGVKLTTCVGATYCATVPGMWALKGRNKLQSFLRVYIKPECIYLTCS